MKLVHGLGLAGTITLASMGAFLGCSGDDSKGNPGTTDASTGSDTSTAQDSGGTANNDSGAGSETSTGDDGGSDGGGAPSCADYCAKIAANCTGANQQYQNDTECENACGLFPVGAAGDTTGNTLGCRTNHAQLAATAPVPHCWHAGPFGAGTCGGFCENFCALTLAWCDPSKGFDAGPPPYDSGAACTTACAGFATVDAGSAPSAYNAGGPTAGNTLDCREYHLGNAMTSAANQAFHCPHTQVDSAFCK
jgi:hypothetical protein